MLQNPILKGFYPDPSICRVGNDFYMITTNMTTHENFFCTATDPAGPWSNPVVIRDATGIDASD